MTLLNSNYEEWHMQNPDKSYRDFPLSIKEAARSPAVCSTCGKLTDVSRNVLSGNGPQSMYMPGCSGWAARVRSRSLHAVLARDPEYAESVSSR